MIRPPRGSCAFMIRTAACAHRKAPVRLVSTTCAPGVERQLLQRARRPEQAGVVEQHVEPVEAAEQRLDRRGVGDVGGHHHRPRVAARRLLQRLAAAAGEHDAPVLLQQRPRDRPADARPGAGDERYARAATVVVRRSARVLNQYAASTTDERDEARDQLRAHVVDQRHRADHHHHRRDREVRRGTDTATSAPSGAPAPRARACAASAARRPRSAGRRTARSRPTS